MLSQHIHGPKCRCLSTC